MYLMYQVRSSEKKQHSNIVAIHHAPPAAINIKFLVLVDKLANPSFQCTGKRSRDA